MADSVKVDIADIIKFYENKLKDDNKKEMLLTIENNRLNEQLQALLENDNTKSENK